MTVAVVTGLGVWLVLAVAFVVWLVVTTLGAVHRDRRVPHAGDVGRWVVSSWAGRGIALAAWAAVGWHVFCQRP